LDKGVIEIPELRKKKIPELSKKMGHRRRNPRTLIAYYFLFVGNIL
jgi:hypothetical protein